MAGRPNQRHRTRKDLLRAAARLMREGRNPTLEEVAAEAMISRATAYRYFSGAEALLLEAALDVEVPDADAVFAGLEESDALARVCAVDAALDAMILAHEPALRTMLVHSLQRPAGAPGGTPVRQNRRSELIEAALANAPSADRELLVRALALVIGIEARIVLKDVLRLSDPDAAAVKAFAIRALIGGAARA